MAVTYGSGSTGTAVRRLPIQVTSINLQRPFDQAVYKGIVEFKACILNEIVRNALRARKLVRADPYKDSYGNCT